jgi:hypothetical protein
MKDKRLIRRLKASIPFSHTNSNKLSDFLHFTAFPAASVQLKKSSGGPKGLSVPHAMGQESICLRSILQKKKKKK